MGKHRLEGGTPNAALRHPRSSGSSHRREAAHPTRNKIMAGLLTAGACAAVGLPLTANAGSGQVEPASHEHGLSVADAQAVPKLVAAENQKRAQAEAAKLEKSRAMEQERVTRAEAERQAKATAEREARQAAERAVAKKRAAEAQAAAEKKAAAEREKAERASSAGSASASAYVKPAEGSFTSGFGYRSGSSHNGVDIANSIGTPIRAVTAGQVIDAGPASGFGQWVRLQHADGTVTVYGHVNTIDVSEGQQVRTGDQIATLGNRGQSTGPHLHFEVIEGGQKIDPLPWLRERGINVQ